MIQRSMMPGLRLLFSFRVPTGALMSCVYATVLCGIEVHDWGNREALQGDLRTNSSHEYP